MRARALEANGAGQPTDIAPPHTVGMWEKTEPVEVTLVKGRNVLRFSREHERLKGVTVSDFTLTPVKEGPARRQRQALQGALTLDGVDHRCQAHRTIVTRCRISSCGDP